MRPRIVQVFDFLALLGRVCLLSEPWAHRQILCASTSNVLLTIMIYDRYTDLKEGSLETSCSRPLDFSHDYWDAGDS